MADAKYETKIVVSAETDDASKKLEALGNTTIETPIVKPVVKTPDPVTAKVTVDPDPVEPKVKQPAPVTIKSIFDDTAIGKAISGLRSVRNAITQVMSAFGIFGLAVNGVKTVIDGIKSLHEWLGKAEKKAKELREAMAWNRIDTRIKQTVLDYEKLNKTIAESVRLEKQRADLAAGRLSAKRTLEDASDDQKRQSEIAQLDPSASDYKQRKAEIERRYELREVERARARGVYDHQKEAYDLNRQADAKDQEANQLERQYTRAKRTTDTAVELAWKAGVTARQTGSDADKAKSEKADEKWKKAHAEAEKIREAMESARREAQNLRDKAKIASGGQQTVNIEAEAKRLRIENARREAEANEAEDKKRKDEQQKAKDDAAQKAELKRKQELEDAVLERQKQQELSGLNPMSKTYGDDRKEIERKYALQAQRNKITRADNDTDQATAEEQYSALQLQQSTARGEDEAARRKEVQTKLESLTSREASIDGVSQNRLTAMGLGSGVRATGGVESDVRKLVDLLRQNVEATKNINANADYTAVYGD